MSEGHELGIPTPALASDAQQQAPPGFENQQSGGEGRPRRRGRPRPRGGARERERREKKERRERQQVTRSSCRVLLMPCTSHSRT
jgi:hypothetical protein